jgi:hypothetical protein
MVKFQSQFQLNLYLLLKEEDLLYQKIVDNYN